MYQPKLKVDVIKLFTFELAEFQMLQQQVNDKNERIQDLENLVHYYEQDVTSTSLFVSRIGARYHLHRDCRALLQANQAGIRDLKCCSQCIRTLRDNSNLGGSW